MNLAFIIFLSGCWASAILMLRSKNPVYSVFYLVLVFMNLSGLLCLLGLEYFLLLQLLVYVGLLAVMFLFVVMLLDISLTEILAHQRGAYPVAGILGISLILAVLLCFYGPVLSNNMHTPFFMDFGLADKAQKSVFLPDWNVLNTSMSSVVQLGILLYGVHVDLLLLASLLLLILMVGAVLLTLKRRAAAPVHDVFVQHSVDFQKVVYILKK
uniref:NADH-ubiquinone oxidoreductase chain 6 n=2 Tax=Pediastrum TaxID=3104 RepID=A0A0N7CH06_PEDDU|nr:NADH dehydrogenase subunit 6 [Pediastrum duplex Group II]AWV57017.1 NADH dehydrogenase subunit 6 [Pediastrum angulosum]